jgi:hypothetical protein
MHQIADILLGHGTVTHDFVGTGIVGHDAVEHAGMSGSVELKK